MRKIALPLLLAVLLLAGFGACKRPQPPELPPPTVMDPCPAC